MPTETIPHHQLLVRAPDLRLELKERSIVVRVDRGATRHDDGHVLRVLDYFSTPHTLAEALQAFWRPGDGAVRWRQISSTILALQRAGALAAPSDDTGSRPTSPGRALGLHVRLLNDTVRTRAYLDAIAATVRPSDVVVDIGTGTGILAMAAARAGARHVYAIEAAGIADTAEAVFHQNGLADRITLLRGWSTSVRLPERADVMVAELVGMDPFDELIGEVTTDAIARLLTTQARLVPYAMRVLAIPVSVPEAHRERGMFTPASAARWEDLYGFDFSPMLDVVRTVTGHLGFKPDEARVIPRLADPITIADIHFKGSLSSVVDSHTTAIATAAGVVNGLLLYFDLSLAPGHILTTAPDVAADSNSWGNRVLMLPEPLRVEAGETFAVRIERRHARFAAWCGRLAQG